MSLSGITLNSALMLRFYARCLNFPYEEMNYELLYIYRTLEKSDIEPDEVIQLDQILNILNSYQGEDIQDIRHNYVILFSNANDPKPLCPLIATNFLANFAIHYSPDSFIDILYESDVPFNPDEPPDSIFNYLELFSVLCEQYYYDEIEESQISSFIKNHIQNWIPHFCDVLYKATNITFYREVANGLKEYISSFD